MLLAFLTASGTIALAVVGGITLIYYRRQYQVSQELAQSTQKAVDAALKEAEASMRMVDEVQRDRALAFRPYLVFRHAPFDAAIEANIPARIQNIGPGPALSCIFFAYSAEQELEGMMREPVRHKVRLRSYEDFAVGAQHDFDFVPEQHEMLSHDWQFVYDLMPSREKEGQFFIELVCCQDIFGTKYRFVRGRASVESVPSGEPRLPAWAEGW